MLTLTGCYDLSSGSAPYTFSVPLTTLTSFLCSCGTQAFRVSCFSSLTISYFVLTDSLHLKGLDGAALCFSVPKLPVSQSLSQCSGPHCP